MIVGSRNDPGVDVSRTIFAIPLSPNDCAFVAILSTLLEYAGIVVGFVAPRFNDFGTAVVIDYCGIMSKYIFICLFVNLKKVIIIEN